MSHPLPPLAAVAAVPSLREVQTDPTMLAQLPLETLLALQREVGHLGVELGAAIHRQIAQIAPLGDHNNGALLWAIVAAGKAGLVGPADRLEQARRLGGRHREWHVVDDILLDLDEVRRSYGLEEAIDWGIASLPLEEFAADLTQGPVWASVPLDFPDGTHTIIVVVPLPADERSPT